MLSNERVLIRFFLFDISQQIVPHSFQVQILSLDLHHVLLLHVAQSTLKFLKGVSIDISGLSIVGGEVCSVVCYHLIHEVKVLLLLLCEVCDLELELLKASGHFFLDLFFEPVDIKLSAEVCQALEFQVLFSLFSFNPD